LALGSFWVLEVTRKGTDDTLPAVQRSDPDYYIEKFNYVRLSASGQARYSIAGDKLTHLPLDDSYEIQQPVMHSLDTTRPPMTLRADHGRIEDDNSKIHMTGNVHIDRPATPTSEDFHLSSEYLLFLPDDDVMRSDKAVQITLGKSILHGTGMFANNATREFTLSSRVRGTYQAARR
jgi:lipopolysaccharide export system protein LptC